MKQFIYALSFIFILSSCHSGKEVSSYMESYNKQPYQVVIVPTSSYSSERFLFLSKIYWAKHLYDQQLVNKIMFTGGKLNPNQLLEAENMAFYTEEIGVNGYDILLEIKSDKNIEEIYYSLQRCVEEGITRVAIASNKNECNYWKRVISNYDLNIEVDYLPINFQFTNYAQIEPVIIPEGSYVNVQRVNNYKEDLDWESLQISMISEDD